MLERRTPLVPKTPLRRTQMRRKRNRSTEIPSGVRSEVLRRDGGCQAPGAFDVACSGRLELHHRETKGIGGRRATDTAEDLLTLCRAHHAYVTEHPAEAIAAGLARRRNR